MRSNKLIIGLVLLFFIPSTFLYTSYNVFDCKISNTFLPAFFYTYDRDSTSDCLIDDTSSTFEIEFFWETYGHDSLKLPDFDKAFDDHYEFAGYNNYAAYMWMFLTFVLLLAYIVLQLINSSLKMVLFCDFLLISAGITSFLNWLEWKGWHDNVSGLFETYFFIPLLPICCVVIGITGLLHDRKEKK
jgi:hypothetical protein